MTIPKQRPDFLLRYCDGSIRIKAPGGRELRVFDWDYNGSKLYAVYLNEAGEVALDRPVVGFVLVSYAALLEAHPDAARRAVLTNAPDLRAAVAYLRAHGTKGAERDAAFFGPALKPIAKHSPPSLANGAVRLGVLRARDFKVHPGQKDLPDWSLACEVFEFLPCLGCYAALGYSRSGEWVRSHNWLSHEPDAFKLLIHDAEPEHEPRT